jgi:hypothetical protein
MNASYPSLGSRLSDTDPINNSVLISGLKFAGDGVNLLLPGRYPIARLGSYIHEALHHRCFRSPVGAAISFLYHRGFQRAIDLLSLGEACEFDELHVLADIARVEAVLHMMRPLPEGIALFGEFDAYPGESRSLSNVFLRTAVAFAEAVPDWQKKPRIDELLRGVLDCGQSLIGTQLRKENLLMQGFTTQNGGYLPGYFMVKNLQFALLRRLRCDKFLDAEFYLHFIVDWFYGDFELVSTLLDKSKTVLTFHDESVDAIDAIFHAFQHRVGALFTDLSADAVEKLDDLLVSSDMVPWWKLQLGMAQSQAKAIEEKLLVDINHLTDDADRPGSEVQRAARAMCYDSVMRRDYLCLGSFAEDIEILTNGQVVIGNVESDPRFPSAVFFVGNSRKPGPWKGKATFDVLQSGRSGRVFFAVYANNELVVLDCRADGFDEERPEIEGFNVSTEHCRTIKAFMKDKINKALDTEVAAIVRDHYKAESEKITETIYRNWCGCLMTVVGPEADISMEPGTLLKLCARDTKFLRTLAALGCVGSPIFAQDDLERVCKANGLTTEEFKARATSVEREHNLRLMYPLDSFFALTV